jgi:hypothetical protein
MANHSGDLVDGNESVVPVVACRARTSPSPSAKAEVLRSEAWQVRKPRHTLDSNSSRACRHVLDTKS